MLKQKITLNHFGQLPSHISPINMQRVMLLIEKNKILFYNRKIANVFNEIII